MAVADMDFIMSVLNMFIDIKKKKIGLGTLEDTWEFKKIQNRNSRSEIFDK